MKYIREYIDLVRSGEYCECLDQLRLCQYIEECFEHENIYIDEAQVEKYLSYQRYFEFDLFPWEKFVFVLHNCTYKKPGILRWPYLFLYLGRGAGKNGYLAFEDFCLLTKTNGVREYNIDIFAMSEDQARTSWQDVYNLLERNEKKMKRHFSWNKERIVNLDTNSEFRYRTSKAETKDGGRPGKVDFDEYHAYVSSKLVDVATTGLGKKKMARRTVASTDGFVRDGLLDQLKEEGHEILYEGVPDNGKLIFMCFLNDPETVDDESHWHEANPSLRYMPDLLEEMRIEYADYKRNQMQNASFMVKRMNRPLKNTEDAITTWDNVLATNQEIDSTLLINQPCVAGIDYMKTTDFLAAGLLFRIEGKDIWVTHTWVCRQSQDLSRIKAPLDEWEARGLLTFVEAPEIPADLPAFWLRQKEAELGASIIKVGIDQYRYQMVRDALERQRFLWDKKAENSDILLVRPSNEMQTAPLITSRFVNHAFAWGDNPLMRWAAWNTKMEISKAGNITYGKIEPKSRKTDPFKALVAAECVSDYLNEPIDLYDLEGLDSEFATDGVYVFD